MYFHDCFKISSILTPCYHNLRTQGNKLFLFFVSNKVLEIHFFFFNFNNILKCQMSHLHQQKPKKIWSNFHVFTVSAPRLRALAANGPGLPKVLPSSFGPQQLLKISTYCSWNPSELASSASVALPSNIRTPAMNRVCSQFQMAVKTKLLQFNPSTWNAINSPQWAMKIWSYYTWGGPSHIWTASQKNNWK